MASNITQSDLLKSIYNQRVSQYTNAIQEYSKRLDSINAQAKKSPTFFDYLSAAGTIGLEAIKGFKNAQSNFYFSVASAFAGLYNDLSIAVKRGELSEFGYAVGNLFTTGLEGMLTTGAGFISTLSELGAGTAELFGVDTNEEKRKFVANETQRVIANFSNAVRASMQGEGASAFTDVFNVGNIAKFGGVTGGAQAEENRAIVEERNTIIDYSGVKDIMGTLSQAGQLVKGTDAQPYTFEKLQKDMASMWGFFNDETDELIEKPFSGMIENAEEAFGDKKLYELLKSTSTSVGEIASMIFVAKMAGKSGVNPSISGQTYYFSSIAGRSYQEALNNGATVQDALTYALGVAGSETIIENIGGMTFGKLLGGIQAKGVLGLGKNMFEEGLEEVLSELTTGNMEYYSTGEIKDRNAGEILTDSLYSFLSGALASGVIGTSQVLTVNRTLNKQVEKLYDTFNGNVRKYGEELAIEMAKNEIRTVFEKGSKGALGIVVDGKINQIKKMDKTEFRKFVESSFLNMFVKEVNGEYVLDEEKLDRFDIEVLKNRVGTKVIEQGEFAVSDAVYGKDITNNGKVVPSETKELTDLDRKALQFANDINSPVVLYYNPDSNQDGFFGENGIVYVNSAKLTEQNVENVIIKHEATHEIAKSDPLAFEELKKSLRNIGRIVYQKDENGMLMPVIEFTNEKYASRFKSLQAKITASYTDYVRRNIPQDKIVDLMEEELVTYFSEDVITDAKYIDIIESINRSLYDKLKNAFKARENFTNKESDKLVRKYIEKFEEAVKSVEKDRLSFTTFLKYTFATEFSAFEQLSKGVKSEYKEKYGMEAIGKALATMEDFVLTIDGDQIELSELLNETILNLEPSRVEAMTNEEIIENFDFKDEDIKVYIKNLKQHSKKLDQMVLEAEEANVIKELKNKIEAVDDLIFRLKEFAGTFDEITNEEKIIIIDAMSKENKPERKKTVQKTEQMSSYGTAVINANQVFIRSTEKTGFDKFKNGSFSQYGGSILTQDLSELDNEYIKVMSDALSSAIELHIYNHTNEKGQQTLRGNFKVNYYINENKTVDFVVTPTEDYLMKKSLEIEEKRSLKRQRTEELDNEEYLGISRGERKELDKFYTPRSQVELSYGLTKEVLSKVGFNIETANFIESSAGDGAFVKFLKERGKYVTAYDIKPENPDVIEQDFLTLEKEFDKNAVVIGNPPFKLIPEFFEKSFEVAPVVSFILPMEWHENADRHAMMPDTAKLVLSYPMGIIGYRVGKTSSPVKTVLQVWVDSSKQPLFNTTYDYRERAGKLERTHPDLIVKQFTGTDNATQAAAWEKLYGSFDFGVEINVSLNTKTNIVTDFDQIKSKNGKFFIAKALNEKAKEILKQIDYERLLDTGGSSVRRGFYVHQFIRAYETKKMISEAFEKSKVSNTTPFTVEEIQKNSKIYGDEFIASYFELDKNGNYVPKMRLIESGSVTTKEIEISHKRQDGKYEKKKYSTDEYMINIDIAQKETFFASDSLAFDVVRYDEFDPVYDKNFLMLVNIIKKSGIRFVVINSKKRAYGWAGIFQKPMGQDVLVLNAEFLSKEPEHAFDTLFHEFTHQMFYKRPEMVARSAQFIIDVIFNPDGTTTDIGDKLFDDNYSAFVRYMTQDSYSYTKGWLIDTKSIKTIEESKQRIYDLLKDASEGKIYLRDLGSNQTRAVNELLAQIYGRIFSNKTFINTYFKTMNVEHFALFDIYGEVLNGQNQIASDLMKSFGSEFYNLYTEHQKIMRDLFPNPTEKVTLADINKFINDFTEGAFKSRGELVRKAVIEMANGKKGDAVKTLDHIIFLSSKIGATLKSATNAFNTVSDELKKTKETILKVIQDTTSAKYLADGGMKKDLNFIIKLLSETRSELKVFLQQDPDVSTKVSSAYFESVLKKVSEFIDSYEQIDDALLDAFELPNKSDLETLVVNTTDIIEIMAISTMEFESGVIDFDIFSVRADSYEFDLKKFIAGFEKIADVISKDTILKNIANLQGKLAKSENTLLIKELETRTKNALKEIKGVPQQSVSQLNNSTQRAIEVVDTIIKDLKSSFLDSQKVASSLLTSIKALEDIVFEKKEDGTFVNETLFDKYAQFNEKGELDYQATYNNIMQNVMKDIYGYYAVIFGNEKAYRDMFFEDPELTLKELGYTKNYRSFAISIGNLLRELQTKYTTVYSGDTQTHKEYAKEVFEEVVNAEETTIDFEGLKGDIQTPQEVFRTYAEVFGKNGVKFFKSFYDLYVNASLRKTKIYVEYIKMLEEFTKNNKKIREWTLETVEIPNFLFVELQQKVNQELKNKAKANFDAQQEEIEKMKKILDITKVGKAEQYKKIAELNKAYKALDKNSSLKAVYKEQLDELKKEHEETVKTFKIDSKIFKTMKSTAFSYDYFLKEQLFEYQKNNPTKNKMTRGDIVNYYMNLRREVIANQRAEEGITDLKPTNHFGIGNYMNIMSSETVAKDGYSTAKNQAEKTEYVFLLDPKSALEELQKIIDASPNYEKLVEFSEKVFDMNYEYINEIYQGRFNQDLLRELFYSPFRTLNSDWLRNFELKLSKSTNIGTDNGMTLETTIGSKTPLVIQNIFDVIEGSTNATANYSFERVIKDYQNLMVMKPVKGNQNTVYNVISQKQNGFSEFVEKSFIKIIGYGDSNKFTKTLNNLINNINSAIIIGSVTSTLRQYISITTIIEKFKLNPVVYMKNIANMNLFELAEWLKKNNPSFYARTLVGGNTALADTIRATSNFGLTKVQKAIRDTVGAPQAFADAHVLVATFATLIDKFQKENPNLTEEEVRQKANEFLEKEVMLFGIASTETAFRSTFTSSKNPAVRLAGRFMSENVMQISALWNSVVKLKNGVEDHGLYRNTAAFMTSSILSALIGTAFRRLRGDIDDEEVVEDFFVNELLLNNLLGAIPVLNILTSSIGYDSKGNKLQVYTPKTPVIGEFTEVMKSGIAVYEAFEDGRDPTRKIVKLVENLGTFGGIPVTNMFRFGQYALRFASLFGDKTYIEFEQFFYSRTAAQQLNLAIKQNDKAKVDFYVSRSVDNTATRNEIMSVFIKANKSISLYQTNSFRAKNPATEKFETIQIPEKTKEKYNILTQRALNLLIRTSSYKKLNDEEKAVAIQRIINYYYNFMKNELLVKQYKTLDYKTKQKINYDNMRSKKILDIREVIANAVKKEA
jgi:hypothetical protein